MDRRCRHDKRQVPTAASSDRASTNSGKIHKLPWNTPAKIAPEFTRPEGRTRATCVIGGDLHLQRQGFVRDGTLGRYLDLLGQLRPLPGVCVPARLVVGIPKTRGVDGHTGIEPSLDPRRRSDAHRPNPH